MNSVSLIWFDALIKVSSNHQIFQLPHLSDLLNRDMTSNTGNQCIYCHQEVRPRQQALLCDGCNRWQHRSCNTRISQAHYRKAVQEGADIDWSCQMCSTPIVPPSATTVTQPLMLVQGPSNQVLNSTAMNSTVCSSLVLGPSNQVLNSTAMNSTVCSSFDCDESSVINSASLITCNTNTSGQSSSCSTNASGLSSTCRPTPSSPDVAHLPNRSALSFENPLVCEESNINNTIPSPDAVSDTLDEDPDHFVVVPGASKRGCDLLVEKGFTYHRDGKKNKKGQQRWRCSVRNKNVMCLASVIQDEMSFTRGAQPHRCTPSDCALPAAQIKSYLRSEGKARPFVSGAAIVNEALGKYLPTDAPCTSLSSVSAMIRSTNLCRQKRRPQHPKNLEFEWVEEAIPPNFIQSDIRVGSARHIIFHTAFMLTLLSAAKTWYVDGTFKSVQKPFYQLWSIHGFIKQNEYIKQVPLMTVLMSRRSKADYKAILELVKSSLPTIALRAVVLDFETAVWSAFREIFPLVTVRGCNFHWSQAIFRKIKEYGMYQLYCGKSKSRKFLRELMSLPFLPPEEIPVMFQDFQDLIGPSHHQGFHQLLEYMESTWISSRTFPPSSWSVFGQVIRTNNDVEGWHNGLNKLCAKAGNDNKNINVYELIEVLYQECQQVATHYQLVSEGKLQRYQRKTFREYQGMICDIWDAYKEKSLTPVQLMEQVSSIQVPSEYDDCHTESQ